MVATIEREVWLTPEQAWSALTDFEAHGQTMPLTQVMCDPDAPDSPRAGWRFIARTRLGPLTIDDPMRITRWDPPGEACAGLFRVDKLGRVLGGWTVALVLPAGRGGSKIVWTQHVRPRLWLPPFAERWADRLTRWLYGRALDQIFTTRNPR